MRRRLLVLASYPPRAAATRFRACAYFPALAARGIDADLHPFMDDAFMRRFYEPGGRAAKGARLLGFALRRLALLLRARRYDGVFVQREAALVGPALFEAAVARGYGLPLIFDLDDAIWVEQLAASRHPRAARLLKSPGKTHDLLGMARAVVAGSRYLADYAARFARGPVTVVPTVVSREAWTPLPGRLDGAFASPDGVPTLGWVGTHSTATHLDLVVPALRALAREGHRFRVRLVGAARTLPLGDVPVENVPWREATEVQDFQRADIGVVPVRDDAWSRGKCGFKQVQFMHVGVPLVSSPVGGATEVLEHGVHGLLAASTDEWVTHLRALLHDHALRARLARAARDRAAGVLSTEAQAPALVGAIEAALDGRR